jgi:ABC-type Fe3+/spermidine/putrescine transport system ATPase subunit
MTLTSFSQALLMRACRFNLNRPKLGVRAGRGGAGEAKRSLTTPADQDKGSISESPSLRLTRLRREFGSTIALNDLDLQIHPGEFVSLLGPSGSGKTTTLNLIAGFDYPTSGSIHLGESEITWDASYDRGIGMVFQNYALFPHMTVFENVAFPLRSRKWPGARIRSDTMAALKLVQLESLAGRYPRQLSGGQQQRVALARAIVYRPRVLLMDEPLGALDRRLRADMQIEIKRIHRTLRSTIVYVTHDQEEALTMSDRIAILHEGRLQQFATPPEIYARPATRFVAGFVGDVTFLDAVPCPSGRAVSVDGIGDVGLDRPLGAADGGGFALAVRPEQVSIAPCTADDADHGEVEEVLFLGDARKCVVALRQTKLLVKISATQEYIPRVRDTVRVRIDGARSLLYRATGELI